MIRVPQWRKRNKDRNLEGKAGPVYGGFNTSGTNASYEACVSMINYDLVDGECRAVGGDGPYSNATECNAAYKTCYMGPKCDATKTAVGLEGCGEGGYDTAQECTDDQCHFCDCKDVHPWYGKPYLYTNCTLVDKMEDIKHYGQKCNKDGRTVGDSVWYNGPCGGKTNEQEYAEASKSCIAHNWTGAGGDFGDVRAVKTQCRADGCNQALNVDGQVAKPWMDMCNAGDPAGSMDGWSCCADASTHRAHFADSDPRTAPCKPGQGESGAAISWANAPSFAQCSELCANEASCKGFDFSKEAIPDACRLYGDNTPRYEEPGSDSRQYCTAHLA